MIRAVDNKRLFMTDSEYAYYKTLVKEFGEAQFKGLMETDKDGYITSISPPLDRNVSMGVLFFALNIMMSQRLSSAKNFFEKKIASIDLESNMLEKVAALEERIKNLEGEQE